MTDDNAQKREDAMRELRVAVGGLTPEEVRELFEEYLAEIEANPEGLG